MTRLNAYIIIVLVFFLSLWFYVSMNITQYEKILSKFYPNSLMKNGYGASNLELCNGVSYDDIAPSDMLQFSTSSLRGHNSKVDVFSTRQKKEFLQPKPFQGLDSDARGKINYSIPITIQIWISLPNQSKRLDQSWQIIQPR